MKLLSRIFVLVVGLFFSVNYAIAQCAMCRVTIENNVSNGDTKVGAGLNTGILYLLTTPYVLLATIGFIWYRHARKRKKMLSHRRTI